MACRLCNMGFPVFMQTLNSILLSLEFFCNPVQLLIVEISSGGVASCKNLPMNSSFDFPPHAQHHLLRVSISRRYCYTCLTSTQPLASMCAVNVQHQLLIASNKIAVKSSTNINALVGCHFYILAYMLQTTFVLNSSMQHDIYAPSNLLNWPQPAWCGSSRCQ